MRFGAATSVYHPRVKFWQFKMPRGRERYFVEDFLVTEELRNRERRVVVQLQIKLRDVQAGQIDSVVDAVMVRIVFVRRLVPTFEFVIEDQVQFQVHMRALAINSHPGVAHYRDALSALN